MIKLNKQQLKIAKYIMAKQFRFVKYEDQIYLYDDLQKCSLIYIVKKEFDVYTVYKLKKLKQICHIIDYNEQDVLNVMLQNPWNFMQLEPLMEQILKFDIHQLYYYMVEKQNMNKQDFNLFFECNLSLTYKTIQFHNIVLDYHNTVKQSDVNDLIDKIQEYIREYPKIFNNKIYICIKDKIINHDGKQTNGNNILNKQNYDIAICVDLTDPIYVISHQFGHSYQDLYLEKQFVDGLFQLNKTDNIFNHRQNLYKNRTQFIPQLFAAYNCNQLDIKTKQNFQKHILNYKQKRF